MTALRNQACLPGFPASAQPTMSTAHAPRTRMVSSLGIVTATTIARTTPTPVPTKIAGERAPSR
jgi:hypothetical protein